MDKILQIGIINDRSRPSLGLHGLHTAFHGLPGVELAALADGLDDGVENVRQQLGAKRRYRTMEEMFAAEKLDIAVICSRAPSDHAGQIKAALQHNCHIFCEKPLTANLQEAAQLVKLVKNSGLKLCMAHPGRYATPFLTIKKLIEQNEIGDIVSVETYGKSDHRGGGEDLMTLGTHMLDLMVFLFGPAESVMAELRTGGKPSPRSERTATVEEIGPCAGEEIFADFRFAHGIRGTFFSKKGLADYHDSRGSTRMGMAVVGTKGILSTRFTDMMPDFPVRLGRNCYPAAYGDGEFIDIPDMEAREIPGARELDADYLRQFSIPQTIFFRRANRFAAWDLIEAIRKNRQTVSNVNNGYAALEMIYGIYASHCQEKLIHFPLEDIRHPLEIKYNNEEK